MGGTVSFTAITLRAAGCSIGPVRGDAVVPGRQQRLGVFLTLRPNTSRVEQTAADLAQLDPEFLPVLIALPSA